MQLILGWSGIPGQAKFGLGLLNDPASKEMEPYLIDGPKWT